MAETRQGKLLCDPLGSVEQLTEAQRAAVARLGEVLSDTPGLTKRWASKGRLIDEDDKVRVWIGEPDGEALRDMAESFERQYGSAFPADLAHTLSLFNGLALTSEPDAGEPEAGASRARPRDLPEPALWPANAYGDHFMLADADLDDDVDFYVIGEIADSGYVALGVTDDGVAGVYWIDRELSLVAPKRIAADFSDYLSGWCAAALCLPLLLGQSSVPGWGD